VSNVFIVEDDSLVTSHSGEDLELLTWLEA
jgi:hypothetical protein